MCELWRGVRVYTVYYLATAFRLVSSVGSSFFFSSAEMSKVGKSDVENVYNNDSDVINKRSVKTVYISGVQWFNTFQWKMNRDIHIKKEATNIFKTVRNFSFFFIFDPIEMCGFRKSLSAFLITSGQFSWAFQITILPNQFPKNNEYLILFNGLFHM